MTNSDRKTEHAPQLKWRLRWRLSVLWALQWAITGSILTYLPLYFTENGLTIEQLGQLMAVAAVGLWIAPFVVAQVCDRWLATDKYLALSHFLGGLTLVGIPIATNVYRETGDNFGVLIALIGAYACFYFPTVPLATSLTLRHLPDPDAQFGKVRIWGTVGWVLAGLSLSVWLDRDGAFDWLESNAGNWSSVVVELRSSLFWLKQPTSDDCFRMAAILSFALSSFCAFLPATPPARAAEKQTTIAPLQTFKMFANPTFTNLIVVSAALAMIAPFYTLAVPKLLEQLGYESNWIPAVMTVGQISEFPALILLPYCLKRFGLKTTFSIGIGAWVLRYALFAFEDTPWLVLTGIALHGICHVFLIIVVQLYIDSQARFDLRASVQNLFAFITMGIAMPVGFLVAGKLAQWCVPEGATEPNYQLFFAAPAVAVLLLQFVVWKWIRFDDPRPASRESKS